jgi:hypothetical protein
VIGPRRPGTTKEADLGGDRRTPQQGRRPETSGNAGSGQQRPASATAQQSSRREKRREKGPRRAVGDRDASPISAPVGRIPGALVASGIIL